MTAETLSEISRMLGSAGIPYCFGRWNRKVIYPYFVGEYIDREPMDESGERESIFILTGTGLSDCLSLEKIKERIERLFPTEGVTAVLGGGTAMAVMLMSARYIPVDSDSIKKIEIKLKVKEWRI